MAHKNSSLRPVDVQSSIFALQCANDSVYLLVTQDASRDLEHFRQGSGSPFCAQHPFERVLEVALTPGDALTETATSLAAAYRDRGKLVCSEYEMTPEELGAIALMRRAPVKVGVHTYVLELQPIPGHGYPAHYVGKSQDLTKRWANHWASTAAKWTARHRPVRVIRVDLERGASYSDSRSHEDEVTLALMREAQRLHGPNAWASVRGGRYTAITMGRPHEL